MKKNSLFVAAVLFGLANASVVVAEGAQQLAEQSARPLSAFFWVRQQTAPLLLMSCVLASGEDGMPVVLSHTINPDSLQAEDFRVVRQSGAINTPMCVT